MSLLSCDGLQTPVSPLPGDGLEDARIASIWRRFSRRSYRFYLVTVKQTPVSLLYGDSLENAVLLLSGDGLADARIDSIS